MAAKEIKKLIESSVSKVESESALVDQAGSAISEVVALVQRMTDIISEITAASVEQSEGIGQVKAAMGQMEEMTQRNASLVEQSSAAALSLKEQTHLLAEIVGAFVIANEAAESPNVEVSNGTATEDEPASHPKRTDSVTAIAVR